ncbi:hypothetical protein [Gemmobacter serpentinus]|uniref:hypothetical protein n=1 Tax=Gemmobacter serpentinus TaxID=2652247 RepID=UPI001865757B|nr:hypothetical protein [Gemmobacter serpentinus]
MFDGRFDSDFAEIFAKAGLDVGAREPGPDLIALLRRALKSLKSLKSLKRCRP